MTHRTDVARGRDIVARWCALAEQRLEHLTELFETGRWRRYHTERSFLENIQEAKCAVEIWRDLSNCEASRDNSAIDISWLGRGRAPLSPGRVLRDRVYQPHAAVIPKEAAKADVSILREAAPVRAAETRSTPVTTAPAIERSLENVSELTPDTTAIAQRYPLLRNAL
jgi:uncharacterized repeat protein (TIGR03809 family)